jgi:hypothetical protein
VKVARTVWREQRVYQKEFIMENENRIIMKLDEIKVEIKTIRTDITEIKIALSSLKTKTEIHDKIIYGILGLIGTTSIGVVYQLIRILTSQP